MATLPAVVVTLLFNDWIESVFSGWFLGFSFLITSLLLFASDTLARRSGADRLRRSAHSENMRYGQALAMAACRPWPFCPAFRAPVPQLWAGWHPGVPKRTAAKFSFLMSAIATLGSLVFKCKDLLEAVQAGGAVFEGGWTAAVLGMIVAAISGYLAIRWMLRLIERVSLRYFGVYTAVVGLLVLCDQLFVGAFFERIL